MASQNEHPPVSPTGTRCIVGRACRMSFWVLYDHLGPILVLNMVTVATVLACGLLVTGIGLSPLVMVGLVVLALFALAGGQGHLINTLLSGQPFEYRSMWVGIRSFAVPLMLMGLAFSAALTLCGVGSWFYGVVLAERAPFVGLALAQLCLCTAVGIGLITFHAVPALFARGGAVWPAWCTGATIVLHHPVGSALLVVLALAALVVAMTPPGLVLLSTWPLVALTCCSYELYARAYGATGTAGDEVDGFLNRGFRDFLYPWKE